MFRSQGENVVITQIDVLAVAGQCSHRTKDFPASYTALPAGRQGVHRELRGDTARAAEVATAQGLCKHQLAVGEEL